MFGPYANDLQDILLGAKQTVAFDFGRSLPSGVALTGTPTLTISVSELPPGVTAPSLDAEFNGAAQIGTVSVALGGSGVTNAAVLRQMLPTVGAGIQYLLVARCARDDGDIAVMESHVRVMTAE